MKSYETKDFIISYINNEIKTAKTNDRFKSGVVEIEYMKLIEKIDVPEIDYNTIKIYLDSLINDNLIISIVPVYQSITIRPTALFYEATETENGWYTSKYFTEQMKLELLATRLEKLSLELNKLENNSSIIKEYIPSLASTTATIASTLDIISKMQ